MKFLEGCKIEHRIYIIKINTLQFLNATYVFSSLKANPNYWVELSSIRMKTKQRKQLKDVEVNIKQKLQQKCMQRLREHRHALVQQLRECTEKNQFKDYQETLKAKFEQIVKEECKTFNLSLEQYQSILHDLEKEIENEYDLEGTFNSNISFSK